jgi:hypothetical protein
MNRRSFLGHGVALTPLAALLLSACKEEGNWPENMVPFKWDRDTCTRCKMSISDRRFAAQIRGGVKNTAFKFDDVGCATTWRSEKLREHPWMTDASTQFWVAAFDGKGEKWLSARSAHYLSGKTSPMAYNFAAFETAQADTVGFDAMCQKTSGMLPADCIAPTN